MGYILAGTVGFISSLIAYYAIQKIPYVTEVNSFILAEPEDVFEYMKNPRNLPDINYKIVKVDVVKESGDVGKKETFEYEATEDFPHLGKVTYTAKSVADPELQRINTNYELLFGMVDVEITMKCVMAVQADGTKGTLVSEEMDMYIPQGLFNFINKTMTTTHGDMLNNAKFVIEDYMKRRRKT